MPLTQQPTASLDLIVLEFQVAVLQGKLSKDDTSPARASCASGRSRGWGKTTGSAVVSAFFFGFSLLWSRNLSPFLLFIQVPCPNMGPSWHHNLQQLIWKEIVLGQKRAQAVVYCVLYTMNIFAFANRLKIVPPLIVI